MNPASATMKSAPIEQTEYFTPDKLCVNGHIGWFNAGAKGRGAVALQDIPANTLIESDPVVIMPIDDIKNAKGGNIVIDDYIFCWETLGPDQDSGLFALPLGNISLCNHSVMPNARVDQDHANRLLKLVALRNIAKGEEITVDYAIDLWFKPES